MEIIDVDAKEQTCEKNYLQNVNRMGAKVAFVME